MQRSRTMSTSWLKQEMFLIGEQLRFMMDTQHLIADRKYHLRTYKSCFIGSELVDWLFKTGQFPSREVAVTAIMMLQEVNIFHHVCDDHLFKDDKLFYRFRYEDGSYDNDRDLQAFYTGQRIFKQIRDRRDIMKNFNDSGHVFQNTFTGISLIDWMIEIGECCSRDQSVGFGRELLEREIIKHVTDDFHFRDGNYRYQFCLDFNQPYILSDIFRLKRRGSRTYSSSYTSNSYTSNDRIESLINGDHNRPKSGSISSNTSGNSQTNATPLAIADFNHYSVDPDSSPNDSVNSMQSNCSTETNSDGGIEPKSVLFRQVSVSELEEHNSPYVKKPIKIMSDSVGFGFVLRGKGPTYVQTVDPMGPAASAGLKVRQYVFSVNGVKVLDKDHVTVGRLIQSKEDYISLVVLSHYKDR